RVAEARRAVTRKARVENLAVLEINRFEQRAADALDDRAFDLIPQSVGVDDGAAFKGRHDAHELHLAAGAVHGDLGAVGHVTGFLEAAGDPEAMIRRGFRFAPTESFRRRFQHGAQPFVFQVLQAEIEWIQLQARSQLVNVNFAREVVGGRSQRAIRPLAQRIIRAVKDVALLLNRVNRLQPRIPGIVIVKIPGCDNAVFADAARHINYTSGTEIGPGELFFARPDRLDRLARGFGQARGLDRRFAGVLTAVARSGVGNDDAHAGFGNAKSGGQFASHAEGTLRACP